MIAAYWKIYHQIANNSKELKEELGVKSLVGVKSEDGLKEKDTPSIKGECCDGKSQAIGWCDVLSEPGG